MTCELIPCYATLRANWNYRRKTSPAHFFLSRRVFPFERAFSDSSSSWRKASWNVPNKYSPKFIMWTHEVPNTTLVWKNIVHTTMFFGCRQNTTHFFLQLSNTVAYFLPSARWVWGRLSCHGTQWPLCWLSLRRVCSGAVSCWRSKWKHQPANTLWWHLRTPTDTGPYSSNMYIHCMIGVQLTYPHHPCTCVNFMTIQYTPLHWGWAKVLATRSASSAELMGQAGGCKATLRTLPAKSGCAKHMHLCAKHQNSRLAKVWILLSKAVWGGYGLPAAVSASLPHIPGMWFDVENLQHIITY